jgi:hypothetical protein
VDDPDDVQRCYTHVPNQLSPSPLLPTHYPHRLTITHAQWHIIPAMTKSGEQQVTSPTDMRLLWCKHDVIGEDEICVIVSERQYFELEKRAQQRGKTVVENLYPELIDQLKAHGYNTPLDCFYVTAELPDDPVTGKPQIHKPTYN